MRKLPIEKIFDLSLQWQYKFLNSSHYQSLDQDNQPLTGDKVLSQLMILIAILPHSSSEAVRSSY